MVVDPIIEKVDSAQLHSNPTQQDEPANPSMEVTQANEGN